MQANLNCAFSGYGGTRRFRTSEPFDGSLGTVLNSGDAVAFNGWDCLLVRCTNMSLISQLEKETRVLRARDVAKLFQVTPQHVYKMAADGRLPSFRLAGAIRFDPHELANWLRKAQPVPYRLDDGNQLRRSA
jgi:excisionase family DNA binding protein